MKHIVIFLWMSISYSLLSQTPQVLHKKFGGTTANFQLAVQNKKHPIHQTNFGLPPTIFVKKAVVDSIIAINDSTVIVVTAKRVVEEFKFNEYNSFNSDTILSCHRDSMLQKSIHYDASGKWKPGRDTLVNHAIFHPLKTCEEIAFQLANEFKIDASIYKTIYIGFDCGQKQEEMKKNEVLPFWNTKQPYLWMSVVVILASFYLIFQLIFKKGKSITA